MISTTNRCRLCGCVGGHQNGCKNRQGSERHTYRSGAEDRQKVLRDLLEAAEEMYRYCEPEWNQAAKAWAKAAIEAARKEIENG
jgi:hypothetical protein